MIRSALTLAIAAAVIASAVPLQAGLPVQSLGNVQIPRSVMANGQSLSAGTYAVRVSDAAVTAVVGQAPEGTTWVEFLRNDQVAGRELATVLTGDAVAEVAKGGAPASGSSKVEMLKGNEYLRVWINQAGTHYLIHFAVTTP